MFVLLKNYACAGAAKGDNQELLLMAFKVRWGDVSGKWSLANVPKHQMLLSD